MTDYVPTLLTGEPETVAHAADLHTRLTTLGKWIDDRKGEVTGWLRATALERKEQDGASPTWRFDTGSVLLTDPKPQPKISDRETFARWYDDRHPGQVVWRHEVTVNDPDLFVDMIEKLEANPYVSLLVEGITRLVEYEQVAHLPGDALDTVTGDPSIKLVQTDKDQWTLIDTDTGEAVPGVTVTPPGQPQIQVRPSTDTKTRLREELDGQIGPAQLTTTETP